MIKFAPKHQVDFLNVLNRVPVEVRQAVLQQPDAQQHALLNDYLTAQTKRLPVLKQSVVFQQETPMLMFEKLCDILDNE